MRRAAFLIVAFVAVPLFGEQPVRVEGRVTTQDSENLPGCTARIQSATLLRESVTDINGRYVFTDIPGGSYDLSIELSGLRPIHRRVAVSPGLNTLPAEQMDVDNTAIIISSCGSPCAGEPDSEFDKPLCDEYEMNTSLIEALERGDRSALVLLQQRSMRTSTFAERHRLAGALLRRVPNDSAYWNELAGHAANFVRFARAQGEYTPEFIQWCAERQLEPDKYWYMALNAFTVAGEDRRSRSLLQRALASEDMDVVLFAIEGFGHQRDHAALTEIEKAIQRFADDDRNPLVLALAWFGDEDADRIAMQYLSESDRAMYEEFRAAR